MDLSILLKIMFSRKVVLEFVNKSNFVFDLFFSFFVFSTFFCIFWFPVDLRAESSQETGSGADAAIFDVQPYLGGWSLEPLSQKNLGSTNTLLVIKPSGLISKIIDTRSGSSLVEEGEWTLSDAPVQGLLVDGVLVANWGAGSYSFIYRVGSDVYLKFSKKPKLSKEEWDDAPVHLLKSEKAELGAWASRRSNESHFDGSIQSKVFVGFWGFNEDNASFSQSDVLQIFIEKGAAVLYSKTSVSEGHWFLEENQIRISWKSGIRSGREDVLRCAGKGFEFLCYPPSPVGSVAQSVVVLKIFPLDAALARSRISGLKERVPGSKPAASREKRSRDSGDQPIVPGFYSVTPLGAELPTLYFKILPRGEVQLISKNLGNEKSEKDRSDSLAAAEGKTEGDSVHRKGKGHYQLVLNSALLEWETGFKEVIYPMQNGGYRMDSFLPGSFLDEAPVATFTLVPVSEDEVVKSSTQVDSH